MQTEGEDILREVFYSNDRDQMLPISELEIKTGMSHAELRPLLEDLKREGLLIENRAQLELSYSGLDYAKSRWV